MPASDPDKYGYFCLVDDRLTFNDKGLVENRLTLNDKGKCLGSPDAVATLVDPPQRLWPADILSAQRALTPVQVENRLSSNDKSLHTEKESLNLQR